MDIVFACLALGLSLSNLTWLWRLQKRQSTHVDVLRTLIRATESAIPNAMKHFGPKFEQRDRD